MFRIFHQAVGEKAAEGSGFHPLSLDSEHIIPGFPPGGVGLRSKLGNFHIRLIYTLLIPFHSIYST